jgi:hypothetical protein
MLSSTAPNPGDVQPTVGSSDRDDPKPAAAINTEPKLDAAGRPIPNHAPYQPARQPGDSAANYGAGLGPMAPPSALRPGKKHWMS